MLIAILRSRDCNTTTNANRRLSTFKKDLIWFLLKYDEITLWSPPLPLGTYRGNRENLGKVTAHPGPLSYIYIYMYIFTLVDL